MERGVGVLRLNVKFDLIEGIDSATNKPAMVNTREGEMTAEEISRLVNLPTFVKATIKNKDFSWKKPVKF